MAVYKLRVLEKYLYIPGLGNFYENDLIDYSIGSSLFEVYLNEKKVELVLHNSDNISSVDDKSTEEIVIKNNTVGSTKRPIGRPKKGGNDPLSDEDVL